jgi:hypothetical protein
MKPIRAGIMQHVLLKTTSQDVSAAKVLRNMDQFVKVNILIVLGRQLRQPLVVFLNTKEFRTLRDNSRV